jgi:hypothetical protein
MSRNHDLQRFESAQRSRDALRIANQPVADPLVTVTTYNADGTSEVTRIVPPPPVPLEVE